MKTNFILGTYKNGNYQVTMLQDGTKIRKTDADDFIPEFPENADVKITDKCSQGCKFCYEGCTKDGEHGVLINEEGMFARPWMNTLQPYTELALNGNDLDHPDLMEFLQRLRENDIIPNITVNQHQFMKNIDKIKNLVLRRFVFGVGVSLANTTDPNFFKQLKYFPNAVLHTIAGILTKDDIEAIEKEGIKVLILGYKNLGRGINYKETHNTYIANNIEYLKKELPNMVTKCKVLSFDNLAIEQLDVKNILFTGKEDEWNEFYMGDDGNFTLYIDAVANKFAKNSCMPEDERFDVGNMTMTEMFNFIRDRYGINK